MNPPDDQQIENLLRRSPQPAPPRDLKEKLIMQIESSTAQPSLNIPAFTFANWLRRWWATLVPAGVSIACAAVFIAQQNEIRDLKQNIQALSAPLANQPISGAQQTASDANNSATTQQSADQEEIARLKSQVGQLTAEIAQLEHLQMENQKLRAQLAAPRNGLTSEETQAMDQARERAARIQCVNNLKQIGLAVRIWMGDNNNTAPPDFLSMSNELNTPKILVCPEDSGRQVAANFSVFTTANCSYTYFVGGMTNVDRIPDAVMTRCPIHGTVGLCDGSVQSSTDTNRPLTLIKRDNLLYLQNFGNQ